MLERRAGAVYIYIFLNLFLLFNKARGGSRAATQQYTVSIIIIIGGEHLLCHLSETTVTVLNPCIYCIKCSDNAWLGAMQWNLILKPNGSCFFFVYYTAALIVGSNYYMASGAQRPQWCPMLIEFGWQTISAAAQHVWTWWAVDHQRIWQNCGFIATENVWSTNCLLF